MTDTKYEPGTSFHFELIDATTGKSNTFFHKDPSLNIDDTTLLSLTALEKVTLYGNDTGNCNNFNYTLALVFPKTIFDSKRLNEITEQEKVNLRSNFSTTNQNVRFGKNQQLNSVCSTSPEKSLI